MLICQIINEFTGHTFLICNISMIAVKGENRESFMVSSISEYWRRNGPLAEVIDDYFLLSHEFYLAFWL